MHFRLMLSLTCHRLSMRTLLQQAGHSKLPEAAQREDEHQAAAEQHTDNMLQPLASCNTSVRAKARYPGSQQ